MGRVLAMLHRLFQLLLLIAEQSMDLAMRIRITLHSLQIAVTQVCQVDA
jgi:hypothetical protein